MGARKAAAHIKISEGASKAANLGASLLMLIAVSLLKQPRDGVMGCAAEFILGPTAESNYPKW